jgi:hypothetical protein
MNYIYEKIMNESETAIFDKKDLQLFEEYVTKNYKEFYENKISYEVEKKSADEFLVTLFDNTHISLEDILREIKD